MGPVYVAVIHVHQPPRTVTPANSMTAAMAVTLCRATSVSDVLPSSIRLAWWGTAWLRGQVAAAATSHAAACLEQSGARAALLGSIAAGLRGQDGRLA